MKATEPPWKLMLASGSGWAIADADIAPAAMTAKAAVRVKVYRFMGRALRAQWKQLRLTAPGASRRARSTHSRNGPSAGWFRSGRRWPNQYGASTRKASAPIAAAGLRTMET